MGFLDELIPYAGLLGYTIPLVFSLGVTYSTLRSHDENFKKNIEDLYKITGDLEDRVLKAEISVSAIAESLKSIHDSLKRIETSLIKHIDNHG